MFARDSELFLEYPDEPRATRVLYRGVVTENERRIVIARFRDPALHTEPDTVLRAYFEHARRFSAQLARVAGTEDWIADADGEVTSDITLELLGEPIPTEQRESYRVSAYGADLCVDLAGEARCPVLDISATGLSALATRRHEVGAVVDVVIRFEGQELVGLGTIQTALVRSGEQLRYGIHVAAARDSELAGGMMRINLALQRRQLARLAGSG